MNIGINSVLTVPFLAGKSLQLQLREEGVQPLLQEFPGQASGKCLVFISEPDTQDSKTIERTMLGLPGASRLFTRRWFDDAQNAEVLRSAYIVYAVGFNLSTEER